MESKYENFTDLIMTSYRAIQKIKAEGMKKVDLKAGDVNCIYYLSRYRDGLSNARLADLSGVDKAAISRTLNPLMEKGYVTVSPEDAEKIYGKRYVLTEKGNVVAKGINQMVDNVVAEVGENIDSNESEVFYKTFRSICEKLVQLSEEKL